MIRLLCNMSENCHKTFCETETISSHQIVVRERISRTIFSLRRVGALYFVNAKITNAN